MSEPPANHFVQNRYWARGLDAMALHAASAGSSSQRNIPERPELRSRLPPLVQNAEGGSEPNMTPITQAVRPGQRDVANSFNLEAFVQGSYQVLLVLLTRGQAEQLAALDVQTGFSIDYIDVDSERVIIVVGEDDDHMAVMATLVNITRASRTTPLVEDELDLPGVDAIGVASNPPSVNGDDLLLLNPIAIPVAQGEGDRIEAVPDLEEADRFALPAVPGPVVGQPSGQGTYYPMTALVSGIFIGAVGLWVFLAYDFISKMHLTQEQDGLLAGGYYAIGMIALWAIGTIALWATHSVIAALVRFIIKCSRPILAVFYNPVQGI